MSSTIIPFLRSMTAGSWLRIVLTIILTTVSVRAAYGEAADHVMIIGCNIITVSAAFFMEYKNFKSRS